MRLRDILNLLRQTQEEIGSSPALICGGVVRDKIMSKLEHIEDIDITSGDKTIAYLAQQFSEVLRKDYNITYKNMSDHSSLFIGNLKMDFSSNFNAPNIDQLLNNKGIDNPTSLDKEMYSRDFTCNALLMTLDLKKIIDPTKMGMKDIENKIIRTCLAPEITLTCNRNRVIRIIYLAAKLGFEVDPLIIDFVKHNPQSLQLSSPKAIKEKLISAFKFDKDKTISLINQMNLQKYLGNFNV